ncbi:sensor histidine kinase [Streptomyces sp. NPDC005963]|uniref:sensor histidine kinase n=1 Tax=Streptomyces sp. NPDC005963 TaxID=3156721 RepID=UPI0033E91D97
MPQPAPRLGERILTAISRDPLTAPNRTRNDAHIAAGTWALTVAIALFAEDGNTPDALGWLLLVGSVLALVWRRSRPGLVLLAVLACSVPYHAVDHPHAAAIPALVIAQYTFAATVRPLYTSFIGAGAIAVSVAVMFTVGTHEGLDALRSSGWLLAVLVLGTDVRIYRRYIASVVGRAEHAERTREEEAARRVAEERLRIARDLHDLLAHSITLIGVRTSVASHVLLTDPERLDRTAIAQALDDIAETCRTARGELRTTLAVLRTDAPDRDGPLPDLAALPDLVRPAAAGLTLDLKAAPVPPAVGAAAYRIVQESLTNAVRHAGPDAHIDVAVVREGAALVVTVRDDGRGPVEPGNGYGIIGMRERARSVGGTLTTGARAPRGFQVTALLPVQQPEAMA